MKALKKGSFKEQIIAVTGRLLGFAAREPSEVPSLVDKDARHRVDKARGVYLNSQVRAGSLKALSSERRKDDLQHDSLIHGLLPIWIRQASASPRKHQPRQHQNIARLIQEVNS